MADIFDVLEAHFLHPITLGDFETWDEIPIGTVIILPSGSTVTLHETGWTHSSGSEWWWSPSCSPRSFSDNYIVKW